MTKTFYSTIPGLAVILILLLTPALAFAQAEPPAEAPEKPGARAASDINVDFSQILSNVAYSNGQRADTTFSVLALTFPSRTKIWYGYYQMAWNPQPGLRAEPYFENYYTLGGKFYDRDRAWYQVDCFRMTDSKNRLSETLGGEYCHRIGKNIWAGAGYYSSNYFQAYKMNEYTLRLQYYATPRLTFNTKLYMTETSEHRHGTALQEKIDFGLTEKIGLQVRGSTGKRIHALDNDNSSFYSQFEDLKDSLGAQVSWGVNREIALFAGYSQDNFDGYFQKITFGGMNIKF